MLIAPAPRLGAVERMSWVCSTSSFICSTRVSDAGKSLLVPYSAHELKTEWLAIYVLVEIEDEGLDGHCVNPESRPVSYAGGRHYSASFHNSPCGVDALHGNGDVVSHGQIGCGEADGSYPGGLLPRWCRSGRRNAPASWTPSPRCPRR